MTINQDNLERLIEAVDEGFCHAGDLVAVINLHFNQELKKGPIKLRQRAKIWLGVDDDPETAKHIFWTRIWSGKSHWDVTHTEVIEHLKTFRA